MANPSLNVYRGPSSVQDYFSPDKTPPLPVVELPDTLNPFRADGVRVYAKLMTMHPANNVKAMPALNLLERCVVPGRTRTVIEYSSGSTVISMALVSRVFHAASVDTCCAFLSNKTSLAKLRLMQFFGLDITLFGGPSQPEPKDERGGIRAAARAAQQDDAVVNPDQYGNADNWRAHVRWTGPQIVRQLPEINLICAGLGTSGTMTGLGTYFMDAKPDVFRLGVVTAAGDRVPGPRSYALLAPVEFPWRAAVDHLEHVGSYDSFALSLRLTREGIVCGPSSGFNLQGLYQFLRQRKAAGTLADLAGPDGETHCVFLCCDLPYQYIDEYFAKLGPEHFPAIRNEELAKVDPYRYDEAWEKDACSAAADFFTSAASASAQSSLSPPSSAAAKPDVLIVDLRTSSDYARSHVPASVSLPHADPAAPSPFADPGVLAALWTRLEAAFSAPGAALQRAREADKRVLVTCYDGDSARVATSVLRAKGWAADSVRGGFAALEAELRSRGVQMVAGEEVEEVHLARGEESDGAVEGESPVLSATVSSRGSDHAAKEPEIVTTVPALAAGRGGKNRLSAWASQTWKKRGLGGQTGSAVKVRAV